MDPYGIDLQLAASTIYADELKGLINDCGLEIAELSTHLQGQLVADNPAYDVIYVRRLAPQCIYAGTIQGTNRMDNMRRASQHLDDFAA